MAPAEASEAVGMAAGHDAPARGRADRRGGVEAVEPQPVGGHGVEVRGLEDRMAVVGHIAPALVIGHAEDDIGFAGITRVRSPGASHSGGA